MSEQPLSWDWQTLYRQCSVNIEAQTPDAATGSGDVKLADVRQPQYVPTRVQSGLIYTVLESELTLSGVRRIVALNGHDLLYASISSKCVFLPIDWQRDITNTVKVHERGVTWQTTFNELLATRPVELHNLFSRSEIWAEGDYPALA